MYTETKNQLYFLPAIGVKEITNCHMNFQLARLQGKRLKISQLFSLRQTNILELLDLIFV